MHGAWENEEQEEMIPVPEQEDGFSCLSPPESSNGLSHLLLRHHVIGQPLVPPYNAESSVKNHFALSNG